GDHLETANSQLAVASLRLLDHQSGGAPLAAVGDTGIRIQDSERDKALWRVGAEIGDVIVVLADVVEMLDLQLPTLWTQQRSEHASLVDSAYVHARDDVLWRSVVLRSTGVRVRVDKPEAATARPQTVCQWHCCLPGCIRAGSQRDLEPDAVALR